MPVARNLTPSSRTYRNSVTGASTFTVAAGVDGAFVTDGAEIDTRGYNSCRIIFVLGAIAANGVCTLRLKNSDTAGTYGAGTIDRIGADYTNAADTDDNKVMIIEVYRPKRRYLRLWYQRTVGNVTIDGMIVELFNRNAHDPVAQASVDVANSTATLVLNDPTPSTT